MCFNCEALMLFDKRHNRIFNVLEQVTEVMEPTFKARIAAAMVYKNEIIAMGINSTKTHPMQRKFAIPKYSSPNTERIYLHAEIDCIVRSIRKVDDDTLRRSTMYVYRSKIDMDSKKTVGAMSKPCPGCESCIRSFGISRVCYSTEDGYDWL